jgi:2-amino-4-hydroxy-6-hydroxymethyldihydropteridine diphosphokinase
MRAAFDFAPIRSAFGYSEAADRAAAEDLAGRLSRRPFRSEELVEGLRLRGRTVHVLGAADRARQDAERMPNTGEVWAADGATSAALLAGRTPTAIVTDLDGRVEDQVKAAHRGALVFVHAHGDNRPAIERWLAEFPPRQVAGTCQVEPVPPLLNPGGFTDGDRAVFLALALGAGEVRLYGFDYERPGSFSGRKDLFTKPLKLAWARRLIDGLIADGAPVRFA